MSLGHVFRCRQHRCETELSVSTVGALDPQRYGLEQSSTYPLNGILHLPTSTSPVYPHGQPERTETGEGTSTTASLETISKHLMGVYVDKIGYEYMHCPEKDERLYVQVSHSKGELRRSWFSHQVETDATSISRPFTPERKEKIWSLLSRSEELDRFLGKKFPNLKRYGQLGSCIPPEEPS